MPQVESEIRASVDEFVKGVRALVEKSVLDLVAETLEVDVIAAALGKLPAPRARARVKRSPEPRRSRAQAPRAAEASSKRPRDERGTERVGRARAEAPANADEQTASALLAHVTIEPGQGLEELALAMGTPAQALEAPLRKLVAGRKIAQRRAQGKAAYYPL